MLLSEARALGPGDDAPSLHVELAETGAKLLLRCVAGLEAGTLTGKPQDPAGVTLAPLLKKSDGFVDFTAPRAVILNRFRAFKARPGVNTRLADGDVLKVHALDDAGAAGGEAGRLLELAESGFRVACADGSVWLRTVQPPSAKAMPAADYARGHGVKAGARFVRPESL